MDYSINDSLEFDCELREYCRVFLPQGYCLPHTPKDVFISVADASSLKGVPGLLFELSMAKAIPEYAISDEDGFLVYFPLCPGSYQLKMLPGEEGFHTLKESYEVKSDSSGRITIDSIPLSLCRICVNPDEKAIDR